MPYKVEKAAEDDYTVVNTETGDIKAHHPDRESAERQVRLLHEIEKEGDQ